jgi:hypothetical protein
MLRIAHYNFFSKLCGAAAEVTKRLQAQKEYLCGNVAHHRFAGTGVLLREFIWDKPL